jgi:aminopeptidase N
VPGATEQWPPDRLADIRHIVLELHVVPEKQTLRGTVTHFLTPIGAPLNRMVFNLCELTVDAVKIGGREAKFHHEGGTLEVFVTPPAPPDKEMDISITYHGSPRTGLNFTGPDKHFPKRAYTAWSQGQDQYSRYWWPSHDFPNQRSTTEMVITAPGKYEVVSNGKLVSVSRNRDLRIWHWVQDIPHVAYLVSLVVGEFEHWTEEIDGATLDFYTPAVRRKDGERTFARTGEMVRVLADFAGTPYPWAKYAQVVVPDFTWGGMENTSATTLTDSILVDERAEPDFDIDYLLAHELGHQWFGDLITCREWPHAWLNEGFASYVEYVWREAHYGADEAAQTRLNDAAEYFATDGVYRRPMVHRVYSDPVELFDVNAYEKGAWVLWMLRGVLGDDVFKHAVHTYVDRNKVGLVTTEDMQRAFEDASGRSLGWFFDQWVYGSGHPEFDVKYRWDEDGGVCRLLVRQTQKVEGDTHLFRMPLLVAFGQPARKQPVVEQIEIGGAGQDEDGFSFSLPRRPTWVRFDYENRVLKTLKFDRAEELLLGQLHEDEMSGRVEAALELGKKATPSAVDALVEALKRDSFWGVQAAAAKGLGTAHTTDARGALLHGLEHKHARVRSAAATALGSWRGDEEVGRALGATLAKDRSYLVASAAAEALGHTRARNAATELKRALQRDSFRDVIRRGAIAGLAALEDERQLPLILDMAKPTVPQRIRQMALETAAGVAAKLNPEHRRSVREAAEDALHDPMYFARRGAIEALSRLGEASGIAPLEQLIDRDAEGVIRKEARVAVENLRTGRTREEELGRLRSEIDDLRQAGDRLRQRLEKLEPARRPGRDSAQGGGTRTKTQRRISGAKRTARRPVRSISQAPARAAAARKTRSRASSAAVRKKPKK